MDTARAELWPLIILSLIFIGLAALTVMNMLIGVLCEVVSAVADKERDDLRTETLLANMQRILCSEGGNTHNQISYQDFITFIQRPEAISALSNVGVDPVSIIDFIELFFSENDKPIELTFESFMEVVLDLRESNQATIKDMLNLWMKIKMSTNKEITNCKKALESLARRTDEKIASVDAAHDRMEGEISSIIQHLQRLNIRDLD